MISAGHPAVYAASEKVPPRIVIVDDDASIREALKSLMRSAGFRVDAFASAEEFLTSGSGHTSCLILDVYLPGMSGFELQRHLNNRHLNNRLSDAQPIPIVFITAHADEALRRRAMEAGAADLLSKPVRREALFRAIESAMPR